MLYGDMTAIALTVR